MLGFLLYIKDGHSWSWSFNENQKNFLFHLTHL